MEAKKERERGEIEIGRARKTDWERGREILLEREREKNRRREKEILREKMQEREREIKRER